MGFLLIGLRGRCVREPLHLPLMEHLGILLLEPLVALQGTCAEQRNQPCRKDEYRWPLHIMVPPLKAECPRGFCPCVNPPQPMQSRLLQPWTEPGEQQVASCHH